MLLSRYLSRFFVAAGIAALSCACTPEPRNTEELIDPWLRERTPINFRLESQIGAAVISNNWKDDAVGTISVSIHSIGHKSCRHKLEITKTTIPRTI